jgi:hypothetical protein
MTCFVSHKLIRIEMSQKRQLKEEYQVKNIVEKNQDIIDAMKKLSNILDKEIMPENRKEQAEQLLIGEK